MHIFFYLISIAIFSSKTGKSKEVFSDGKFKGFEVGFSQVHVENALTSLS